MLGLHITYRGKMFNDQYLPISIVRLMPPATSAQIGDAQLKKNEGNWEITLDTLITAARK